MTTSKLDWKVPTALGLAVLALGSGIMGPLSVLTAEAPGLPRWSSFTATTIGDTLLLPILAASLLAIFRYLPGVERRREKLILVGGFVVGAAGGLVLQLSWVLDNKPRLSWILPRVHHFSPLGYYHAIFLCTVSGLLFLLAFGIAYRLKHLASNASLESIQEMAASPLVFVILVCIWTFSALTVQGGGSGISHATTIVAVAVPSVLVVLLCIYALQARWFTVLPTITWALVFAGFFYTLVIRWPATLYAIMGLVVALTVASAVSFRDSYTTSRIVEVCLIGVIVANLAVLPLRDPGAVGRNVLLGLGVAPIIVGLTTVGPLVRKPLIARCSWRDAGTACVFIASVPLAAWLSRTGVSNTAAEALVILLAAAIVGARLVPWYQSEMAALTEREEAHSGVIADPELSKLARRTAVRGTSWGIAAVCVLIGLIISVGPSMGFVYGSGTPAVNLWLVLAGFLAASISTTVAGIARRSSLAPVAVVGGNLAVFGLAVANIADAHHDPWWTAWVAVVAALTCAWQMESIVGNAAMRPRWLVRREWRHAVAISISLAVGALVLVSCTDGMINSAGRPANPFSSLLVLAGGALIGLILVVGTGWAVDWQPKLIANGYALTAGKDNGEPNWAGYRLRGCILMDFGLISGLITIGIWLPSLALAHIGLSSHKDFFNASVMAFTGMLLFIPTFIWTMRNSVRYVNQQSEKAGRVTRSLLYGTLPYVSLREERQVLRNLFRSQSGPVQQDDWSKYLSSHQLHLNLIALAVALVSVGGAVCVFIFLRQDMPEPEISQAEKSSQPAS